MLTPLITKFFYFIGPILTFPKTIANFPWSNTSFSNKIKMYIKKMKLIFHWKNSNQFHMLISDKWKYLWPSLHLKKFFPVLLQSQFLQTEISSSDPSSQEFLDLVYPLQTSLLSIHLFQWNKTIINLYFWIVFRISTSL